MHLMDVVTILFVPKWLLHFSGWCGQTSIHPRILYEFHCVSGSHLFGTTMIAHQTRIAILYLTLEE